MIFKQFDSTDIVAGRTQPVSTGLWSDGEAIWGSGSVSVGSSFYTSSRQTQQSSSLFEPLNGLYYTNVYDAPTGSSNSDIYFSIAYGHYAGSGSSTFDTNSSQGSLLFPTKAIYNQYRNLLLSPGDDKFTFISSSISGSDAYENADDIYAISFRNAKYKDKLDPGQFEMTLSGSGVGGFGTIITIIDDSRINPDTGVQTGGKRYNLLQGTLASGSLSTRNYQAIGLMYPDLGIIILNAKKVHELIGKVDGYSLYWNTANEWGSQFARMSNLLFSSIKNGAVFSGMKARVTEYVPARHFFVRVKNQEYNYSNNPTFVISDNDNPSNSQDIGKLRFSDFYTNPKVYITTVGLYNDNNDLVAVAKLSQPLLKDFTNECLIKIKIDV
jgi:hypothetical protein